MDSDRIQRLLQLTLHGIRVYYMKWSGSPNSFTLTRLSGFREEKIFFKQNFVLCIYPPVIAVIGIPYVRLRDQNGKCMEEKNPIYLRSSPPSAMWICLVQCKIKFQKLNLINF